MQYCNQHVVAAVQAKHDCKKKDAELAVALVTDAILEVLAQDDCTTLRLHKLGVMKKTEQEACVRRNPRTGEPVDVPARKRVTMKIASNIQSIVNEEIVDIDEDLA